MASVIHRTRQSLRQLGNWLSYELGLQTILNASRDVHIIILSRFLRMLAYGTCALILALYFAELGYSDTLIGLFMTLTLLGDVAISLLLTIVADGLGRRRTLILGTLMMVLAGAVFANSGNYWLLLGAAIVGVISPSGNEIGPFRAIEESTLAQLVEKPEQRPDVFAWYVVLAQVGTSLGLLGCGFIVERLKSLENWTEVDAYRFAFWIYTGLGAINCLLASCLTEKCEVHAEFQQPPPASEGENAASPSEAQPLLSGQNGTSRTTNPPPAEATQRKPRISRQTLPIILKLCAIFAVDSLASGMVPFSLINYYMDLKFGLPKSQLGSLMSASWFCGAVFNLFAASLAKRIGLVKTMVFTHLPSAIFLGLIPVPQSLALTMLLLVSRACLSSMDQAPRSAFLSAVVKPTERTAVMGIVNVVKTLSQSGGPVITGALAQGGRFWIAFAAAGALKVSYDVVLLSLFVNVKLHGHDGGNTAQQGGSSASENETIEEESHGLLDERSDDDRNRS